MVSFIPFWLTGIVIGVVSEAFANLLSLWRYKKIQYPISNIIVMFGLVCGLIAFFVDSLWVQFLIMAGIGVLYEILNFKVLDWWEFKDDKMLFIKGKVMITAVLAVTWGLIPVFISLIKPILFGFIS